MAKHNPDMFGASLVFESDGFAQSEDPAGEPSKSPVRFFRLKELRATDIVDDPAATDGLFSALSVSAQATDLLDQNPALVKIIFSNPNAIIEFLNNYLINNTSTMNFSDSIKENFRRLFNLSSSDNPPATDSPAAGASDDSPADPPPAPADDQAALIQRAFSQFHALMPLPDISTDDQGRFFFQSADSPQMLSPEDQIATMFQAIEALHAGLQAARSSIADLTDRLAARPTIPSNVTDPQVSSSLSEGETDDTGKQILKNLPPDLLYKFRLSAPHAKPQKP
ncbi:MAG: hypothetical protein Q8S18_01435 [Bacteroidales bacterium]|nr:hypothetical protein [Bacteroidales bacterium]